MAFPLNDVYNEEDGHGHFICCGAPIELGHSYRCDQSVLPPATTHPEIDYDDVNC